jgi:DNA-binding transcriptional LysR family regulator
MKQQELGNLRIKLLYEYILVTQYRSLNKAALALGVSSSSLSKHIAELERSLGVLLLNRGTHLSLTPAGRRFAEDITNLLEEFEGVVEHSRLMHKVGTDELRIEGSAMDFKPRNIAYEMVRLFFREDFRAGFRMVFLNNMASRKALSNGTLDLIFWHDFGNIGIIAKERLREGLGLIYLNTEKVVIWASRDHPILKLPRITLDDALSERIMDMGTGTYYSSFYHDLLDIVRLEKSRLKLDVRIVDQYYEFLLLDPGMSIYIIPESFAEDPRLKTRADMECRPIDDDRIQNNMFLAYELKSQNQTLHEFVKFVQEHYDLSPETARLRKRVDKPQ